MKFNKKDRKQLQAILKLDALFLQRNNIIDYSLLVMTEKLSSNTIDTIQLDSLSRNQFWSQDCQHIYHLGIIDYLQEFTTAKRMESWLKTSFKSKEKAYQISCVHPSIYSERFVEFMTNEVFEPQRYYDFDTIGESRYKYIK